MVKFSTKTNLTVCNFAVFLLIATICMASMSAVIENAKTTPITDAVTLQSGASTSGNAYTIFTSSGVTYARNLTTDAIDFQDSSGYKVVQWAINKASGPIAIEGTITISYPIMPKTGTTLDLTSGGFVASNNLARSIIEIIGVDNVKITGGKIDGNKAGQTDASGDDAQSGILIKRASNVLISYVTIVNTAVDGVRANGSYGGSSANYANNIRVINCNFDECGGFHPGSGVRFMGVVGGLISNCIINNSGYEAVTGSSNNINITIDHNQLINTKLEQGIYFLDTIDMTITNNLIDSNGGSGIQVRVARVDQEVSDIIVQDNMISNNIGKGIRFENVIATSIMKDITITNNVVKNNHMGGLELATVINPIVRNNNFYDDLSHHAQSLSVVATIGQSDYGFIEDNYVQGYNGYTAIYHYVGGTWGPHITIHNNICTAGNLGDSQEVVSLSCTWKQTSGNLASTNANWENGTAPSTGDSVYYTSLSTAASIWDISKTVGAFNIDSGYSGTITIGSVNFGYSSFVMEAGTYTANINRYQSCSNNFICTGGTITNGVLNLNLTGNGKTLTLLNSVQLNTLNVLGTYTYSSGTNYYFYVNNLNIGAGDKLTISNSVKVSCYYYNGAYSWTNNGIIDGSGILEIQIYNVNRTINLGTINCPLSMKTNGQSADRKITLGSNTNLGSSFSIASTHATYLFTMDLAGHSLSASSVTASTRGVISSSLAGARLISSGPVTVMANGQLDARNIVTYCSTNIDYSAGIYLPGTTATYLTGTGTIKLSTGQNFYDLKINSTATRTLLSNIAIQHRLVIDGTVAAGTFTQNIKGTSTTPFTGNGTWSGVINVTSTGASYTIWASKSWTGTLNMSKTATIIFSGGQLVCVPPASTWYNVTMKGWNSPSTYRWYLGSTNPTANITFSASGLNANGRYDVYLNVYNTYRIASSGGVVGFYHDTWTGTGHLFTLKSHPLITSGAPTSGVQQNHPYYYNGTADQKGVWGIVSQHTWLSVNSATGRVTGTPSNLNVGVCPVSLRLVNGNGTAFMNYTLTVINEMPTFSSCPITSMVVSSSYEYDVQTNEEGYGVHYSITDLTGQLAIDSSTGVVSGSVHLPEDIPVRLSADDGHGGIIWQDFIITVESFIPIFMSIPVTDVTAHAPYSYMALASGNGLTYSMSTNASFLTIDHSSGLITGTATVHASYYLHICASNSSGSAWQNLTLLVNDSSIQIISTDIHQGMEGENYSCFIRATGTDPIYSMSTNASFLSISPFTGEITGHLNASGTWPLNVTVSNSAGSDVHHYTLKIIDGSPVFVSNPIVNANNGVLYRYDANASGSSVIYSMASNARFLTIDRLLGIVSGVPDRAGAYWVKITATNAYGSAIQSYTIHGSEEDVTSIEDNGSAMTKKDATTTSSEYIFGLNESVVVFLTLISLGVLTKVLVMVMHKGFKKN